jgi:hypothetical protein
VRCFATFLASGAAASIIAVMQINRDHGGARMVAHPAE